MNYKNIGTINANNVDEFFANYIKDDSQSDVLKKYKGRIGNIFTIQDGTHNSIWAIAGIDIYYKKGSYNYPIPPHNYLLIAFDSVLNVNPNLDYNEPNANCLPMNSTATTGVSQNPLNPLYNDVIDPDTGEIIEPGTHGVETAGKQAYYGSDMRQIHLPNIANNLHNILGDHMILFNAYESITLDPDAYSCGSSLYKGATIANKIYTNYIELMSEIEVYGSNVFSSSGFDTGMANMKLPFFNFFSPVSNGRNPYWLRSVSNKKAFCTVGSSGASSMINANEVSYRIRPMIMVI